MAYTDNFPQRPVFMADFANGGKIDPRATFSRSDTPPTYAAPSAVHYWSNEKHLSSDNLLTYSNPNNAVWNESNGASVTTNAAAAPDGTTTASSIVEDSANSQHRTFASINATSGQVYTLVAYLKANGRTIAQVATSGAVSSNVEFDLSSSGTATTRSGSPANSSISQIGSSGWYKCSFQVTAGSTATLYLNVYLCDSANSNSYTGDGSSGVYAYGFNLSTTGQLVHEDTSGQIHREYAPTLKSVATAGQPRFEYDPASDGQSMGILIEGSATNLARYSSDVSSWAIKTGVTVTTNTSIAPSGILEADLIVATTGTGDHYVYDNAPTVTSGSVYTASVYVKDAGQRYIQCVGSSVGFGSAQYATFDLQTGSVDANGVTASMSSVGNGWWRIQTTMTATASGSSSAFIALASSATASRSPTFTGDGYSGVALFGFQFELGSFASSLISTSGSAVTRAADSASLTMASAGVSQGPVSAVVEGSAGSGSTPHLISLSDTTTANRWGIYRDSLTADTSTDYRLFVRTDSSSVVSKLVSGSASATKFGVRIDTDNYAVCAGGGTVETDTAGVSPVTTTIHIADDYNGGNQANGHIKRLALYGDLSDTNLQALTS